MIERVVVPVDFSPDSDRALVTASTLATWAAARVELIAVVDPVSRVDVEPRLAEVGRHVGEATTCRIVESGGPIEMVLLTELHRSEKELWCVGSHGRGALGEMLRDSLSEEFVRAAHVPVVLVGPHATAAPSGRVLAVGLDGTEQSEAILPGVADLADAFGMTLRLLQVAGSGALDMPRDSAETGYLSRAAAKVPTIDHDAVDYDVLHGGHPAHDIADYIGEHPDVGMVALATRGLSGRSRLLHGSTAFALAHRAIVPVLILHQV